MPCLGLFCKICLCKFPLTEVLNSKEALDHFESAHGEDYCLNRDVTYHIAFDLSKSGEDPRRTGDSYTASMPGGCHRQHALKRTVDYWLDPHRGYARLEGTLVHANLKVPEPWRIEVELPESIILGEILISGIADRINYNSHTIRDIKT